MRHEFSSKVRELLAARAGYRCSVCRKATIGPGTETKSVLRDGVAAHITAASSGGPRHDSTLSESERRGYENGIWVCQAHGREIDSDHSGFSTDALRGLKRLREADAAQEAEASTAKDDRSGLLAELPHATTAYKLVELLLPQEYTFATTSAVRDFVQAAKRPRAVVQLAPDVIIGAWDDHPNVAGIVSTLLSTSLEHGAPRVQALKKLAELCERALSRGDWTRVGIVEPLAFALAAKGHHALHKNVIERLVRDRRWRQADSQRMRQYYGGVGMELAAIQRHWRDEHRTGFLRANDVPRLIDLFISHDKALGGPGARQSLLRLLNAHALLLKRSGASVLAQTIAEFVTVARLTDGPLDRI